MSLFLGLNNLCSRKVMHESTASFASHYLYWAKANIPYKKSWKSFISAFFDPLPTPSLLLSLREEKKTPPKRNLPSTLLSIAHLLNFFFKICSLFLLHVKPIEFAKSSSCLCRVLGQGACNIFSVCWVQLWYFPALLDDCPCFMANLPKAKDEVNRLIPKAPVTFLTSCGCSCLYRWISRSYSYSSHGLYCDWEQVAFSEHVDCSCRVPIPYLCETCSAECWPAAVSATKMYVWT